MGRTAAAASSEGALSSLFDRLADDADALHDADRGRRGLSRAAPAERAPRAGRTRQIAAPLIEICRRPRDDRRGHRVRRRSASSPSPTPADHAASWIITGRGFRALEPARRSARTRRGERRPAEVAAYRRARRHRRRATAERVARYNFEELGRILTDRVASEPARRPRRAAAPPRRRRRGRHQSQCRNAGAQPAAAGHPGVPRPAGAVRQPRAHRPSRPRERREPARCRHRLDLSRATRARAPGRSTGWCAATATPLPVTARLQSVSWQGRAALMLSASPAEADARPRRRRCAPSPRSPPRRATKASSSPTARASITHVSGHGSGAARPHARTTSSASRWRCWSASRTWTRCAHFLEKPARFAETARPSLVLRSEDGEHRHRAVRRGPGRHRQRLFRLPQAAARARRAARRRSRRRRSSPACWGG